MVSRATVIIRTDADRKRVAAWAQNVQPGSRVEFKAPRRSIPQNDRMWAMLTDISKQLPWFGEWRSPEDFKDILTAHFRKCQVVPGIDPGTVVPLGMRTSELGKGEMSAFIECIYAFGAERGVKFGDENENP